MIQRTFLVERAAFCHYVEIPGFGMVAKRDDSIAAVTIDLGILSQLAGKITPNTAKLTADLLIQAVQIAEKLDSGEYGEYVTIEEGA